MSLSSCPQRLTTNVRTLVVSRRVALDHPGTAWRSSDQNVLASLPDDLVETYRAAIDTAATNLIAAHLIDVWREQGYVAAFTSAAELDASTDGPDDDTYLAVWDEAAGRIDPDLLRLAALDGLIPSNAWPYQRIRDAAAARVAALQES